MRLAPLTILFTLAGCVHAAPRSRDLAAPGRALGDDVTIRPLAPGVWLHVTRARGIDANGLLVDTAGGSVLVDTGWNDAQAARLFDFAAARGHAVTDVVVTHAHDDRIGGAGLALRRGARVHALFATIAHARARGHAVPDAPLTSPATIAGAVEVFFPGAGHSDDNTVVWLPAARILYGGCLVKSSDATDLGYTADADLAAWPASLAAVRARYPSPALVVPGHGAPGGDPIAHTLSLLAARPIDAK